MLLFPRRHEARTHGARPLAADSGAVAHLDGPVEALVGGEVEVGVDLYRLVAIAQAQALGHCRAVDDVARIQNVMTVEDLLHLAVELIELQTEEALVDPASRPAVAVLARQRAAVAVQQLDREAEDLGHLGDLGRVLGVDQRPDVETAGAGVGVVGDLRADRVAELLDPANVVGQVLHRHGRVLDERDRLVVALDAHQQAEAHLAHGPDVDLPARLEYRLQAEQRSACPLQDAGQAIDSAA